MFLMQPRRLKLSRGEERRWLSSDVCCGIPAVSPEETQTAQCEGGEVFAGSPPGLDIMFDFYSASCTRSPLKWALIYISVQHITLDFFHFLELL